MRDVILIGLGKFGEKTVETFRNILGERRYQMSKDLQDKVNVHDFVFKNEKSFNYKEVSEQIVSKVINTDTHKFNGKFSYVFVGDLSEEITAKYGFVYSMLPHIFDQNRIIHSDNDCILGFFTFSSMLGRQLSFSDEKLCAMSFFFKQFTEINKNQVYRPPFKDVSGKPLLDVSCPKGPLSRNYIVVTPGDQNAVMEMTSQVFSERIFYELFYLSDRYTTIQSGLQTKRISAPERCFSNFSMIQISRLSELQRYFLKYTLEDQVTDYLLKNELSGTNLDWYEQMFFKMMDIPEDSDEFPIDTAVSIFMKNRNSDVTHLFPSYISKKQVDFKDYVQECREKIEETVSKLKPHYDGFVKEEIEFMLMTLEKGWTNMFRIDKLTGNINTYIKYVTDLKNKFEGWKESLKKIIAGMEDISLDENFKEVEEQVAALQNSAVYKIPFFVPIRQMLIENAVLSLPLKEYLQNLIKKNIAQAFLVQWSDETANSRNPVGICQELIADLTLMKERLETKKEQIKIKKEFIRRVPSYYYIISQLGQDDYTKLLERIESRNFGPAKISEIEGVAKNLFNKWTTTKTNEPLDRQGITKNPTGFVNHVDEFVELSCSNGFGEIEPMSEEFSKFASTAVDKMIMLSDQLSEGSFFTNNSTNYLEKQKILVRPESLESNMDELVVRLDDLRDVDQSENVKNEFTLGAVAYFQDYLYMDYKNLQQYVSLFKEFDNAPAESLSFTDAVSANGREEMPRPASSYSAVVPPPPPVPPVMHSAKLEAFDEELDTEAQYKRAALSDYMTPNARKMLYNTTFATSGVKLTEAPSANQLNALSIALSMDEVFGMLDEDKLQDFARDFDIRPRNLPSAEEQIESIKMFVAREARR